jgi:hypothetical protein
MDRGGAADAREHAQVEDGGPVEPGGGQRVAGERARVRRDQRVHPFQPGLASID